MALNRMSFSMMALRLERSVFPGDEIDALSPAPCAHRAAPYMSAMGLWRPQRSPNVPGPVPASSCNSCMCDIPWYMVSRGNPLSLMSVLYLWASCHGILVWPVRGSPSAPSMESVAHHALCA